jgi:hypothetical protein
MTWVEGAFIFLGGMVFGVFALAWLIMKIYNMRKNAHEDT